MSASMPSIGFLSAAAFILVALYASNSDAFAPVLRFPTRRKDTTLKCNDDNTENSKVRETSDHYYYLQEELTKAREMKKIFRSLHKTAMLVQIQKHF
jgi:hypothetical protein